MGPIDTWWNRHFPAHSYARLAFFAVVAPIISLLVLALGVATGQYGFTLGRYLTLAIGSEVLILFAWGTARVRQDEIDFDALRNAASDEDGTIHWRKPRVPWELPQPIPKEDLAIGSVIVTPKKPKLSPLYDFGLTVIVAWVAMSILVQMFMGSELPLLEVLGLGAIAGIVFALMITFRYSIVMIIALSIALGFPIAAIMHMFFYWLGGDDNLAMYWAIGSVGVFSFLFPPWLSMRRLRGKWERFRIPNWVFTSVVSVIMLLMLALGDIQSGTTESAVAEGRRVKLPSSYQPVPNHVGTTSHELAALTLYFAWRNGDRGAAQRVAAPRAVKGLFEIEYDSSARFAGCGRQRDGFPVCVIRRPNDQIVMGTVISASNLYYVDYAVIAGLDYEIDYRQPTPAATTPSPTPSSSP